MNPQPESPWPSLQKLLEEGRDQGVYTAAVAAAGFRGEAIWQGAAGQVSREPDSPPAFLDTVFDLASLTKPLATALALMLLTNRGFLSLSTPLGDILTAPWLPPDKRPLTIKSLLAHRAGLPAWRPFYQEVLAAPPAQRPFLPARLAAAEPLEYEPETATLYSDLGFMLLQAVVEKVSGWDLDSFCRLELYRPLGLETLGFTPKKHRGWEPYTCAATEAGLISGRSLTGEVHDENAWAAGGVAGHAGLFGTASEVFTLAAWLYRAYHGHRGGIGNLTPDRAGISDPGGSFSPHPRFRCADPGAELGRPLFFPPQCGPHRLHRHQLLD